MPLSDEEFYEKLNSTLDGYLNVLAKRVEEIKTSISLGDYEAVTAFLGDIASRSIIGHDVLQIMIQDGMVQALDSQSD